mgnify:FL=1
MLGLRRFIYRVVRVNVVNLRYASMGTKERVTDRVILETLNKLKMICQSFNINILSKRNQVINLSKNVSECVTVLSLDISKFFKFLQLLLVRELSLSAF